MILLPVIISKFCCVPKINGASDNISIVDAAISVLLVFPELPAKIREQRFDAIIGLNFFLSKFISGVVQC